ncbi:MAG TPA: hypothetical protein VHY83_01970 [Solirubrobacteraceae bacterium]|nr:hypothetical protein [Solirubrobacteraceae bacterium]
MDVFPELTQLRTEHERIRDAWKAETANVSAIERRVKDGKKARELSMRDAFLSGAHVPDGEPDEQVKAELAQAKERSHAALAAYIEHVNVCVATIVEKREAWLGQLQGEEADVEAEYAQLRQQMLAVERKKGANYRLGYWVDLTGGDAAQFPAAHIPYSIIPQPRSTDLVEQARESQRFMVAAYADGTVAEDANFIGDGASRETEDEYMTPAQLSETEVAAANAQLRDLGPGVL